MPLRSTPLRAPTEVSALSRCASRPTTETGENQAKSLVTYLARVIWRTLGHPFAFLFACRHHRLTLPYNDRQTCLDCGAKRIYRYTWNGVEKGAWGKDAPFRPPVAEFRSGRDAILNPGGDNPLFQPRKAGR